MRTDLEAELEYAAAELELEMNGGSPISCNRSLLEQLVNQCVGTARSCVIAAHRDLAVGLVKCRMNPWCNAKETWKYYQALGRCRDALAPCDADAKRRSGCA